MHITEQIIVWLRYGNIGCQGSKEGIQNQMNFGTKINIMDGPSKLQHQKIPTHYLYLDLNGKRPGMTSDGNFSSYLIGRS